MATNNNDYKEYQVRVYKDKTEWYLNGELHREDGPAVEWANGSKQWYLNGNRHRENGPAVEWFNGFKSWWLNGNRHRVDGPAVEWTDGIREWWLNGKEYSESDWKKEVAKLRANKTSCDGRIVEIDGKKYKLIEEK